MAAGRILIVAPDCGLRGSVAFALEAEGYVVTVMDTIPALSWVSRGRFNCTVLDQKALKGPDHESIAFCVKAYPVVLLTARPRPWLVEWVSQIVDMPVTGNAITEAVGSATNIPA